MAKKELSKQALFQFADIDYIKNKLSNISKKGKGWMSDFWRLQGYCKALNLKLQVSKNCSNRPNLITQINIGNIARIDCEIELF